VSEHCPTCKSTSIANSCMASMRVPQRYFCTHDHSTSTHTYESRSNLRWPFSTMLLHTRTKHHYIPLAEYACIGGSDTLCYFCGLETKSRMTSMYRRVLSCVDVTEDPWWSWGGGGGGGGYKCLLCPFLSSYIYISFVE
jgi:hypothetical protein